MASITNISFQGSFDQCQPPAILTWQSDVIQQLKPPFEFLLVPIDASIPASVNLGISIPKAENVSSRSGAFGTLPTYPLSAGTRALALITDANGLGGASELFIVGPSSNSSCLSNPPVTSPPKTPIFTIKSTPRQCQSLSISWDTRNPSVPSDTLSVRAVVPGGFTFELASLPASGGSLDWTVNIPRDTQFLLSFSSINHDRSTTLLETSPMMTVEGAEDSNIACLRQPHTATPQFKPTLRLSNGFVSQSSMHMKRGTGDNIPLIVGLAIGGIALLILFGFLVYLWRERLQYGLSLGRSSPYREASNRIPSSPEASWVTPSPSQPRRGLASAPEDLERGLEQRPMEDIERARRKRKGKERERTRQSRPRHPPPQDRQASSSTSKSNSYLLPPSHNPSPREEIPIPDLNMDALNSAEASDLFTAPTLVGSSSSTSQKPVSFTSSGSISAITPPSTTRKKEKKRPRYEEIPIPELNMDILDTVEASNLFTAPWSPKSSEPPSDPSPPSKSVNKGKGRAIS